VRRRTLILAALGGLVLAAAAQAADGGSHAAWWQQVVAWVLQRQATLHRELSANLSSLGREASLATAWTLVVTSFVYGVLHAVGPGHGKVILTTYLVSHERRVGRAVLLSAVSSFVQAAVAIVLVLGLIWVAGLAGRQAQDAALWVERASYVLVGVLGGWLLWRALRSGHDHGHAHSGHDGHDHHDHHDHGHHHHREGDGHGEDSHAHVVSPEAAARVHDLRTGAAVVLSVGLRPCSGAVLVLVVASLLGLVWAGVLAVLAMAVGTAITVCLLALFAVVASDRAARLARLEGRALAIAGRVVAGLGGTVILAFGILLLWGSFGVAHPLGLGTG